ncbi:HAD family hydrolase [Paracoccus hibiscisoli]|uniref:HAD family phosphatase n=1 Tax=Paracoccus hibiscisoli TaxID=2023261 RepID=A0A4U0QVP6_9RHOB|nr:HAD family phosphatase [Paracoccus hibiscisoli]TJZ86217.1 HAD family phosphatase [Paracoccus hibiscisoli]
MTRRFDAVIFDLDGTLLATEQMTIETGEAALARMGRPAPEGLLASLVGIDEPTSRGMLREQLGADFDFAHLDRLWAEALIERRDRDGIPLRPHVGTLLDALRAAGLPFAIATSSTADQAREKLAAAGLTDSFDIVITRSDVPSPKPAPDVYLLAADRLGIDPARCLAFEDSDVGALAARAAGMTVVQVPDMVPLSGDYADYLATDLIAGARGIGLLAA